MIILFIAMIVVNILNEEENDAGNLLDITGAMQSFEVYHGISNSQYIHIRTSKKFDDKYFEYLENIQEARDKTFLR